MEILEGTNVITAAPEIGDSLGVSSTSVSLVVTAYLVTLAVLIPLSGWMSAHFGARRVRFGDGPLHPRLAWLRRRRQPR